MEKKYTQKNRGKPGVWKTNEEDNYQRTERDRQEEGSHLGSLIKKLRKTKNISQECLCCGICSRQMLSRIEKKGISPNKWILDILFERLSVNANYYGCFLTEEEAYGLEERENIIALLKQGRIGEAGDLLNGSLKKSKGNNVRTKRTYERQFEDYIRLLILYVQGTALEKIEKEVRATLKLTMPNFEEGSLGDFLLCKVERALLVLLADILCQSQEGKERGCTLFEEILVKIEKDMTDGKDMLMQYSKILMQYFKHLRRIRGRIDWERLRYLLELLWKGQSYRTLDVLLSCGLVEQFSGESAVCDFFTRFQEILSLNGLDKMLIWNGIDALKKMKATLGQEEQSQVRIQLAFFAGLVEPDVQGIVLSEAIRKMRKGRKLTQRELAKDICDVKTLSRIENGKGTADSYTYGRLLGKLSQTEEPIRRYYHSIVSYDLSLHECVEEISELIMNRQYERAGLQLGWLSDGLDLSIRLNRQTVMRLQVMLDSLLGEIDAEEALEKMQEALFLTVPREVQIEDWPLKKDEIDLLNNISFFMEQLGYREAAIELLEQVVRSCENIWMGVHCNEASYLKTILSLSWHLSRSGRYEEADKLCDVGLRISYERKWGRLMAEFFYRKAKVQEKWGLNLEKFEFRATEKCLLLCL